MAYKVYYGTLATSSTDSRYYRWMRRTLFYDTAALNATNDTMYIVNPVLNLEANQAGSFEADIPKGNLCWGNLSLYKTVIEIEEDGEVIWQGRVTEITLDFDLNKHIYCEGELAYLNDAGSQINWADYSSTSDGIVGYVPMSMFADCCGSNIDSDGKSIYAMPQGYAPDDPIEDQMIEGIGWGFIEFYTLDSGNAVNDIAYTTAWDALQSSFIDGIMNKVSNMLYIKLNRIHDENGYMRRIMPVVYSPTDKTGPIQNDTLFPGSYYVGALQLPVCTQTVEYGKNLTDISVTQKVNNLVTEATAFGYEKKGWWIFGTTDAISGTFSNSTLKNKYGVFQKWFSVDGTDSTVENLQTAASASIISVDVEDSEEIEVKAIDLVDSGEATEHLGLLKITHIISEPHNLDTWLVCTKATIPLDDPTGKSYTFGKRTSRLTYEQAIHAGISERSYNMSKSTKSYVTTS